MRTAAILFYANYKVKTHNSAWEPGSLHSACLNYVKKSHFPLLPQNAPNMHNSQKCVQTKWQCHQLSHMQVCTLLQTDNHASTPLLSFYRPDALPATQPTASKH